MKMITGVCRCLVFAAVLLMGWTSLNAATVQTVESVTDGIRKVTVVEDNGNRRAIFERRDSFTCGWFEVEKDATGVWRHTAAGREALAIRTQEIREAHRDALRYPT